MQRAARPQQAQQQFFQMPERSTDIVASYEPAAEITRLFDRKPVVVEVVPEADRGPRTLDQALRRTWGSLESEGASGLVQMRATGSAAPMRNRGAQRDVLAEQYNMQARLSNRERQRTAREARDRQETESVLSMEEWNSFNPMQQAAVQSNADLAAAIQKDLANRSEHHASGQQLESYQNRVRDLFGQERPVAFQGLEYAPNTIAFLDERGIKAADLAGKTLADFVSGDTLVSMEEVKRLGEKQPATARGRKIAFAERLARGQLVYQEKLAQKLERGNQLLSEITGRASSVAADTSYGAKLDEKPADYSEIQPVVAERLDDYMQILARPDSPIDQALQVISTDLGELGASQDETRQVWENLIERSRQAATGEGLWFPEVEIQMRPPQEVAEALGAPTLKRQATTTATRER